MTPNLQNRPYFGEVHFFGKNILFYVRQLKCLFPDSLIFITYVFFLTFFIYFILFFNFLFICFSQTYQNDSEGTGQPRGVSIFP